MFYCCCGWFYIKSNSSMKDLFNNQEMWNKQLILTDELERYHNCHTTAMLHPFSNSQRSGTLYNSNSVNAQYFEGLTHRITGEDLWTYAKNRKAISIVYFTTVWPQHRVWSGCFICLWFILHSISICAGKVGWMLLSISFGDVILHIHMQKWSGTWNG